MFIKQVFIVLIYLSFINSAYALTVAVFPIEDMSEGLNGVDFELTEQVSLDIEKKGLDLIAGQEMISFMARNRIRRLGALDTLNIFRIRDELGADFVLYGTVYSKKLSEYPVVGLSLYLVRTDDARIIWSNSGGLSRDDVQNFLGISEPSSKSELMYLLRENVFNTWPKELEFVEKQQLAFDIENVQLDPKYIRPGDEIRCYVKVRPFWSSQETPKVYFKVKGRVYLAQETKDQGLFEASWIGADRDGAYPVTLVLNWPSGTKKVAFLGTYFIDSKPPQVSINLKGVRLQGTVAFRDQVLIIPHMIEREPISKWKISVVDDTGEELMSDKGEGNLPQRFVWRGERATGGRLAPEGIYQVVLKAWDRAKNMGITSQHVLFAKNPPNMILETENIGPDMTVSLKSAGNIPIAFWRMEMRSDTGELIKVVDGQDLPAKVEVANAQQQDNSKVKCILTVKDVLGNQVRKEIKDLQIFALKSDDNEKKINLSSRESGWIEEF